MACRSLSMGRRCPKQRWSESGSKEPLLALQIPCAIFERTDSEILIDDLGFRPWRPPWSTEQVTAPAAANDALAAVGRLAPPLLDVPNGTPPVLASRVPASLRPRSPR